MTGHSNGGSFNADSIREGLRRPVPPYKFGVGPQAMWRDRGCV